MVIILMETLTLSSPQNLEPRTRVPFYLFAIVLSSLSIMIGLVWDISWHMSIGRDGLFSPPHLAIYLGGVTAGVFSGYRVLKITIAGTEAEREKSVRFWGIFYGSLGNLFCIWGSIAMITSAPFDDWWHNTYGLDVTILSPPHTVLLLGMMMIQFGAIVSVLAYQNKEVEIVHKTSKRQFNILFSLSSGFILAMIYTMSSEYLTRHDMHGALFYQVASLLFPLLLVSFSISSRSAWGATLACAVYSILMMVMVWVLPLFPAVPRLGPVLNPITHFQPFDFPLLILFPAIGIDLITQRFTVQNRWIRAGAYAFCFLTVLALVQWPFANLLMSSKGHWFLGTSKWYFGSDPNWEFRYSFGPWMITSGMELVKGMAIALVIGLLAARVGLAWGSWMKRIMR